MVHARELLLASSANPTLPAEIDSKKLEAIFSGWQADLDVRIKDWERVTRKARMSSFLLSTVARSVK